MEWWASVHSLLPGGGRFNFGTWQGVYLIGLRDRDESGPVDLVVTFRGSVREPR